MALFMDVHNMDGGVSCDAVRDAHAKDVAIQGDHGVNYKSYWVSEAEGKIFLDTQPVTLTELEARLAQIKAQNPNVPILVKGDRVAQYQGIMDVLNVVGQLGITQVGLATKPAPR